MAETLSSSTLHPKRRVLIIHGDPTKPNAILPGGKWDEDDFEAVDTLRQTLEKISDEYTFSFLCNHDTLISDLQRVSMQKDYDLVLQLCDEGFMNHPRMELHVTALLEMMHLPFTGTGSGVIGLTYDKGAVLEVARSIGVPIPQSILVQDDSEAIGLIKQHGLVYPLFVKPNSTDGSYGISAKSICRNEEDVLEAIRTIREVFYVTCPLLIQEYIEGCDLNTALIGNPGNFTVLPATEEDYSEVPPELPRILGFESKWDENSPYWTVGTIPAESVDQDTINFMNQCSMKLFERLGLRDYARFDWKLDSKGCPRLLEANPNCGWSYDAHLQRMCSLAGISYSQMFKLILGAAEMRYQKEQLKGKERFVNLAEVSTHRCAEKQKSMNLRTAMML